VKVLLQFRGALNVTANTQNVCLAEFDNRQLDMLNSALTIVTDFTHDLAVSVKFEDPMFMGQIFVQYVSAC